MDSREPESSSKKYEADSLEITEEKIFIPNSIVEITVQKNLLLIKDGEEKIRLNIFLE